MDVSDRTKKFRLHIRNIVTLTMMHLPIAINIVVTNVETLFHRLSNRNSDRIIKYLLQFDMSRRIVKVEHLAQNRM